MNFPSLSLATASVAASFMNLGMLSVPQPSAAEDCHPAYSDLCVSPNRGWLTSIAVPPGGGAKALCLELGTWKGENPVILEWDGEYAARKVMGVNGKNNAVFVRVKLNKQGGALRVYSPGSYRVTPHWRTCSSTIANNTEHLQWLKKR